ncbi:MAG: hypothetical protein L6R37_006327 [Teloschistes peruensis]|nr:MAG: hypothetical protein L6R37_006327 [Teloschistes peruensis]
MDNFPGTDAQVTNTTVPPQQDGLLQELEDDFDLLDSSVFDVSPEYNLQPAKSFGEFSGSVPGPELYHNLDFIPKPIYGGISILSDPRVLTAPSRQTSDDHLASAMSGDGNDDVMWSPTPSIESSNTGKALHQTIDRQLCQKSSTNVPSCDCLVVKVSLLEELGSYKVDVALNEGLATHKCCLVKSASVLDCKVCMSKSESVMLLVLVYERLVSFCEMVTDSCLKHRTHSRSRASSPNLDRPPLMIGNYMVDKDEEWDSLLGALTLTQVKMLGRQLLALRRPASTVLQGSQILKLSACERKMRALIELLKVNR